MVNEVNLQYTGGVSRGSAAFVISPPLAPLKPGFNPKSIEPSWLRERFDVIITKDVQAHSLE